MLEQPGLLVREGAAARRAIVDLVTGASLGFVCRHAAVPSWLSWLVAPVLAVNETEDESLLFTVRRVWGIGVRWEVRDADDHPVGTVRPSSLHDRFGSCLAVLDATRRFRNPAGQELAALHRDRDGVRVEFALALEGEPFVKMLVVAAALVAG